MKIALSIFGLLLLGNTCVWSQTADPRPEMILHPQDSTHYFYEPHPLRTNENIFNLGFSISVVPEAIVEKEFPAPTVDFQFKHGISPAISFYGNFSTNYFTNILAAGLQWNTGDDDLSFAIGSGIDGFAGSYNLGGEFDHTTAKALAYVPIIEIGHRFEDVTMSLHLACTYVLYAKTQVTSLSDNSLQYHVNDVYATLTFEEPFYNNARVSWGISLAYSRSPYSIWMYFDSFDEYLFTPEFFFSFKL